MACDIKIEIFAYKWFCRILLPPERWFIKWDVMKIYKDECLAYPECNEASECNYLYYAILFRRWLFEKSYLEEIQKQINEFRYSQTDFCCYVLRTCNRDDLFGNLTIFERVFATCAFIGCLCVYCLENDYPEIMRYGHICWAMYFDNFSGEFYNQGGWNRLKMVSISYKSPINFIATLEMDEDEDILIKLRRAIKSYSRFKKMGKIDYDECISMSWVKFYTEYKNESSDDDFDEYFEDNHSEKLNYSEVENALKQLKYFCDPSGSEIFKSLADMPISDSLETSMVNLNICDKYMNLESKEETILESESKQNTTSNVRKSPKNLNAVKTNVLVSRELDQVAPSCLKIPRGNSMVKTRSVLKDDRLKPENIQLKDQEQDMKTDTVEHLFENMSISVGKWEKDVKENSISTPQLPFTDKKYSNKILYDSKKEEHEWESINEANKNIIINEHRTSSLGDDTEMKIKTRNVVSNKQNEWKVDDTKKSISLTGQISSIKKNAEERSNGEAQSDGKKEQEERESATEATIPNEEKNTKRQNSNEIQKEQRNNQNECEIMKKEKKITTLTAQTSFPKRRVKKDSNYKIQDIRQKQDELNGGDKKNNSLLSEQMSSIGKNGEKENKNRNSIQKEKENDDVRKFLKMLLVLGDKKGISYVMKTS